MITKPFYTKNRTSLLPNFFVVVFLIVSSFSSAQNNSKKVVVKDTISKLVDTSVKKETERKHENQNSAILKVATDGFKEGQLHLYNNRIIQWQNTNFNLINSEIQNANFVLKVGVDYQEFTRELNALVKLKEDAVEGITIKRDKIQTVRNLTTTSILLKELLLRTNERLATVNQNNKSLGVFQRRLDSLTSNKKLYIIPQDSVARNNYYQQLIFISKDLKTVNRSIKNALDSIQKLQVMGNIFKYRLELDIALTERERKIISNNANSIIKRFKDESSTISLKENIKYSIRKDLLVLLYYYINHSSLLFLMVLFIVAIAIYIRIIEKKYKTAGLYEGLQYPTQVFKTPLASSIVIVLTIFQYLLPLPPFIFSSLLWVISCLSLTVILYNSIPKYWFRVWLVVFILTLLAIADNLLLRYSKAEEIFILLMTVCGIILGLILLINRKKHIGTFIENPIVISVVILIVFEIISFYSLVVGNYNAGKTFMTNGFFTVMIAYLMVWAFYLGNDIKVLSIYLKETDEEREVLILNPNKKNGLIYYLVLLMGWFLLTNRNSYYFQTFVQPFKKALSQPQTFGEFTFTYESIIVFFLVIFISGFLSRLVSFLAAETRSVVNDNRKPRVGSWLLLIRLGIISLGLVIAFASAGIPMDRLALVISALGVGIGFGLQTVVNNLVSGLIIAFEKPVNLDDVIEVGGQSGKMKSIGIRSSVITTWQGSDVIIPNGELLNNNLINWTLGSNKRRIDFVIGVAYGTDLDKVINVLKDLLNKNGNILKTPSHCIQVIDFNESSIDLIIKFWVQHFEIGADVKSDVLKAIDIAFKEHKIEIPYPQQDVHVQIDKKD